MTRVEHFHSDARRPTVVMNQYRDDYIQTKVNRWLSENPHIEVIDVKYSMAERSDSAVVIYRTSYERLERYEQAWRELTEMVRELRKNKLNGRTVYELRWHEDHKQIEVYDEITTLINDIKTTKIDR